VQLLPLPSPYSHKSAPEHTTFSQRR